MAKRTKFFTPEEAIAFEVRRLCAAAPKLDEAAAMVKLMWYKARDSLEHNPHLEFAAFCEVGDYVLYVISAREEHMKKEAPGAPKTSWVIRAAVDGETLAGGPAESIEQAMRFAQMAYQATQGLAGDG